MNERIKELALQAGAVNVWEWASDDVLDTKNMDAKKFAELLIQKCADIGERYADGNYEVRNQILSHFGLDEE